MEKGLVPKSGNILKRFGGKEILQLVAIMIFGIAIRLNPYPYMINIDEVIPVDVIEGMRTRGDWNTDFMLGKSMPDFLKPFGYNFSGYIVITRVLTEIFHLVNKISYLRVLNLFYFIVSYIVFLMLLTEFLDQQARFRRELVVIGMLLFVMLPGQVFDSWMARPESLLSLLIVIILYLMLVHDGKLLRHAFIGLLIGFGVSVKFTFLVWVPIALFFISSDHGLLKRFLIVFVISLLTGFLLGCPYAAVHPDVYLQTLVSLRNQYHGTHPPHSLIEHSPFRMLALQGTYFVMVYGSLFIMPFVFAFQSLFAEPVRKRTLFPLSLLFASVFFYLGTRSVFFERNFHIYFVLALPLFMAFLGSLKHPVLRIILYLCAFIPTLFWVGSMFASSHLNKLRSTLNNQRPEYVDVSFAAYSKSVHKIPDNVRLIDYNDEYSARFRKMLQKKGYSVVLIDSGPFSALPVNTFLTYLMPNYYYMKKGC